MLKKLLTLLAFFAGISMVGEMGFADQNSSAAPPADVVPSTVSAPPQTTPQKDRWSFELTPYLFGSALTGTTGIHGVNADVNASFGDLLENLDHGFMGAFEARRGRLILAFDGVYFDIKAQDAKSWNGPAGIGSATGELEVGFIQQVYQLSAGARLKESKTSWDVFAAGRYTQLDTDVQLKTTTGPLLPGGTRGIGAQESWWDPVLGVRLTLPLFSRLNAVGYLDGGGFGVGSDLTYQALAGLNWRFTKSLTAKAGYRHFYEDYKHDEFTWKMTAHGLYAGLGISW